MLSKPPSVSAVSALKSPLTAAESPAPLSPGVLSAAVRAIRKSSSNDLDHIFAAVQSIGAGDTTELLSFALARRALDCLPNIIEVADEQVLVNTVKSASAQDRSALLRHAVGGFCVKALHRMISAETIGLFSDEDRENALENAIQESSIDGRGDEIVLLLAPFCAPSPAQWSAILFSAVQTRDFHVFALAAPHVDLLAWRVSSDQAYASGLLEKANLLSTVAARGTGEQAQFLLERGFDPMAADPEGETPLMRAATSHVDCADKVSMLLPFSDIEAVDGAGRSALALAANSGRWESTRALLAAGANPDQADHEGQTPLFHALLAHDAETTKAIGRVANRSLRDHAGRTALENAIKDGSSWDQIDALISTMDPPEAIAAVLKVAGKLIPESAQRAAIEHEAQELRHQVDKGRLASHGGEIAASPHPLRL